MLVLLPFQGWANSSVFQQCTIALNNDFKASTQTNIDLYNRSFGIEVENLINDKHIVPQMLNCRKAKEKADQPFGTFQYDGRTLNYDDLPARVKRPSLGQTDLYYGYWATKSYEDAKAKAIKYFTLGVERRSGSIDVKTHKRSSSVSRNSDFSIHTESFRIAQIFANQVREKGGRYGIVFIIDTAGIETLNVAQLSKIVDPQNTSFNDELEILSRGGRNPSRIKAAIYLGGDSNQPEIWLNPNYKLGKNPYNKKLVLARRLLDPEDWNSVLLLQLKKQDKAEMESEEFITSFYGKNTFNDWFRAVNLMEEKATSRLPGKRNLVELNDFALRNSESAYSGYYQNKAGQLLKGARKQYLSWVRQNKFKEIWEEFGIKKPSGELRNFGRLSFSSPLTNESLGLEKINFTKHQLEALKKNPFLTLEKSNLNPDGTYSAKFLFPEGEQVSELLDTTFKKMESSALRLNEVSLSLTDQQLEDQVIEIASEFYFSLVSIHPLWDGNGRTAKILRDWIFEYFGVPPPAFTPRNDLELSHEEMVSEMRRAVDETKRIYNTFGR